MSDLDVAMKYLERARRFRRMAQRMASLVIWPEVEEFQRAGGDVLCEHCGLPYFDHPERDDLHLTCAGDLVKL